MDLSALDEAISEVAGSPVDLLADAECVVSLHRLFARFESVLAASTAAFDAAEGYVDDGAQGTVPECDSETWRLAPRE